MFGVVVGLVTKSRSTLVTPWTVACQPPLSMEFSRQENWSRLPFPSPGDLPDPRIEPRSPALQADFFFPTELREKPMFGASITILGLDSWGLAECLCVTVYLCNLRPCLMLPGQPGLASGGCEGAGLSCLFQRTLTVRDGDRAPLPFSGATYLRSRLWRAARAGLRMDRGSCAWHSAGLRGSEATTGHRKSKGYHSQKDPAGPGFISELGN